MERTSAVREAVISAMRSNPGIHFRELQRKTRIATGQIQYHLYQLEKSGLISVKDDGKLKRYFLIDSTGFEERKLILYLRSNNTRSILYKLMLEGESALPVLVGKGRSSKKFEDVITLLKNDQIVGVDRKDGIEYISLKNPAQILEIMKKYKQSFIDSLSSNMLSLLE